MRLEEQLIYIDDVEFGSKTKIDQKTLYICKEEMIEVLKNTIFVTDVDIDIAKPGEKTRIIPVKDCIEPRFRVGRSNAFPGVTGDMEQVGEGVTKAMKNVAIVTVGDMVGFQEGIIDMWGEGAKYTPFSKTLNVVVDISVADDIKPHEHELAARQVGLKAAEYLGNALEDIKADKTEVFEIKDMVTELNENKDLPKVLYLQMLIAQGLLHDVYAYGADVKHILPTLLHPNEELDGAIVSGNCVAACDKITTYQHQNNTVIKELYKEHGKTLNFLGVILIPELTTIDGKFRTRDYAVKLCKMLSVDGVIVSEEGYGNPDSDLVMISADLENSGIKTVLITDECSGRLGDSQPLADTKPEACAVISTGNVSFLLNLEKADKIIGDIKAIENVAGGWDGCYDSENGTIVCELNAVIGSTSEIGYHNLTVEEY